MGHPVRRILEWVLVEIERLAHTLGVVESTFLHCLPNLTLSNKLPLVPELSLPSGGPRSGFAF